MVVGDMDSDFVFYNDHNNNKNNINCLLCK